jgi:hypothetical protein
MSGGALNDGESVVGMSHSNRAGCCSGCTTALGSNVGLVDPTRR